MTKTTLRNKRLNNDDRFILSRFAEERVHATEKDTKELDETYEKLFNAITKYVEAEFPAEDMEVLKKYKCLNATSYIYLATKGAENTKQIGVKFRDEDLGKVVIPSGSWYAFSVSPETYELAKQYTELLYQHQHSAHERMEAFSRLIQGAKTFNGLVELWPAVEELRADIVGTGSELATIPSEVVNAVRSDPAFDMTKTKKPVKKVKTPGVIALG